MALDVERSSSRRRIMSLCCTHIGSSSSSLFFPAGKVHRESCRDKEEMDIKRPGTEHRMERKRKVFLFSLPQHTQMLIDVSLSDRE